jgi:hypothetical protein
MKMNDWKLTGISLSGKLLAMIVFALIWPSAMDAFPPAPHHAFHGMLRDEHGRPITSDDVKIFFETDNGAVISAEAGEVFEPGINYRIKVPMDSGATPELYQPFAMKVQMPYKIHVKIGIRTYLPIEMLGSIRTIGQPGGISQLDLTLGEDADGDGLPDAWERALLGQGRTLADIKPGDDSDGDGLSNMDEYISGNYAFDKEDGLRLDIIETGVVGVKLEFLAITGRTYTLQQSNDLRQWRQVDFTTQDLPETTRASFLAEQVTKMNVTVPPSGNSSNAKFFKLMVQ